ncbi:hypothetical protein [Streptomyces sp. NPDC001221]
MWRDILDQARLLAERENGTTHFLGSVVLAPEPTFPRWLVVDGQQRLTTLPRPGPAAERCRTAALSGWGHATEGARTIMADNRPVTDCCRAGTRDSLRCSLCGANGTGERHRRHR